MHSAGFFLSRNPRVRPRSHDGITGRRRSDLNPGRLVCHVLIVFATIIAGAPALAQSVTWNGGGNSGAWADGGNWSSGNEPGDGSALVFRGNVQTTTTNSAVSGSFASLAFGNNGTVGLTDGFTLSGSAITLGSSITTTASTVAAPITDAIAMDLVLGVATTTVTTGANHDLSIAGGISGAGAVTKAGVGTLILEGGNSYAGTTTVSVGILNIRNATALGGTDEGTTVSQSASLQIQGGITVNEPLTITGTGRGGNGAIWNVSGTNSIAGPITVAGNSTRISSDAGILTLAGGASGAFSLLLGGNGDIDVASPMQTASLTKDGSGTVVLSTTNSFGGGLTVNDGVLRLGADQAFSTSSGNPLRVQSGTFDAAGYATSVTTNAANVGFSLGGGPAGSRAAITTGTGTLVLTGSSPTITYSASNNPLGATIDGNLEIVRLSGDVVFSLGDSTAADIDLTISAVISGSFGTVRSTGSGWLLLNGLNTFTTTSGFEIRNGRWILGRDALLGQPGALGNNNNNVSVGHSVQGAHDTCGLYLQEGVTTDRTVTIQTTTATPLDWYRTVGGVNTSGTATFSGPIAVNTNVRLDAAAGGTVLFSNEIRNGGTAFQTLATIAKHGLGTVLLTGSNGTTLAWEVREGVLLVNGTNAGGGGTTVFADGVLGGSGRINGLVTVGGTLSPGTSPGVLTLSQLVLESTATTFLEIDGLTRGSLYDGLDVTTLDGLTYGGALVIAFGLEEAVPNETTFDLFSFSGDPSGSFSTVTSSGFYAGTWSQVSSGEWSLQSGGQTLTFSAATGDIVVVPEPATITLLASVCAAVALGMTRLTSGRRSRRRRRTGPSRP